MLVGSSNETPFSFPFVFWPSLMHMSINKLFYHVEAGPNDPRWFGGIAGDPGFPGGLP